MERREGEEEADIYKAITTVCQGLGSLFLQSSCCARRLAYYPHFRGKQVLKEVKKCALSQQLICVRVSRSSDSEPGALVSAPVEHRPASGLLCFPDPGDCVWLHPRHSPQGPAPKLHHTKVHKGKSVSNALTFQLLETLLSHRKTVGPKEVK